MSGEWITAITAIFVAVIQGVFLIFSRRKQNRRDTSLEEKLSQVSFQVTNDHPTNLRDDITQTFELMNSVSNRLDATSEDVREIRKQTNRLFALDREKDKRLNILETSYVRKNIPSPNNERSDDD